MTAKDTARNIIDTLPENADLDEIMQALYISAKFSRGEDQIKAGNGLSHEDAIKKINSWQK